MSDYDNRVQRAKAVIENADFLLIGGGAGLSDAAGLKYTGKRFTDHFAPFIEKYGFEDLYTSSFYPFKTQEERWAYWAKHISVNRYDPPATGLYKYIQRLAQGKEHFVLTTNVEYQFQKAGFPDEKVFMVQGDYGYFQCEKGCHDTLYYNEEQVQAMLAQTRDCRIPPDLVPKCLVCGGEMDAWVHHSQYFVRDNHWHNADQHYQAFLKNSRRKKLSILNWVWASIPPALSAIPLNN